MLIFCSNCNTEKPICQYNKDKNRKNGVYPMCKECKKIKDKESYLKHRDKRVSKCREYNNKNKRKVAEKNKQWYDSNREKMLQYKRSHYQENKQRYRELKKQWSNDNKEKKRSSHSKRRAIKANATPKWLDHIHYNEIEYLHKLCLDLEKLDGVKYSVDHIIPLQNKDVCGLHVPWNLQIITSSDNSKKKNKFDGSYDNLSWILS